MGLELVGADVGLVLRGFATLSPLSGVEAVGGSDLLW